MPLPLLITDLIPFDDLEAFESGTDEIQIDRSFTIAQLSYLMRCLEAMRAKGDTVAKDDAEAEACKAARHHRLYFLLLFDCFTGLRLSELKGATVRNIAGLQCRQTSERLGDFHPREGKQMAQSWDSGNFDGGGADLSQASRH